MLRTRLLLPGSTANVFGFLTGCAVVALGVAFLIWPTTVVMFLSGASVVGFWLTFGAPVLVPPSREERRVWQLERQAEREEYRLKLMRREAAARRRLDAAFEGQLEL